MMEKMIDISAWQGKVSVASFIKVRNSGIKGVILRSSYTTQKSFSLHEDSVFRNNVANAYKAGLKIGVYHYSQAISVAEAKKEAEYTIKIISKYKDYIRLPVFFDTEFGNRLNSSVARKLGKAGYGRVCDGFCEVIKKAGFKTGVYANLSTLNAYLPNDLYKRYSIWLAQYNKTNDYKHPVLLWQYSSSGSVPGISGRIDMNWWYGFEPDPTPKKPYSGQFPKLPKRGWFTSGDKGAEVLKLQKFLNWYFGYKRLEEDSEVGRLTMNAVRDFQSAEGLHIDGGFGPECLKRAKVVQR